MRYLFLCLLPLLLACEGAMNGADSSTGIAASGGQLSESEFNSYISTYSQLKNQQLALLERVNEHDHSADTGPLESITQQNGMDFPSFQQMSERIGVIYSLLEVNEDKFREIQDIHEGSLRQAASEFEEMLNDPDIPEAQKEEIRKAIAQTKQGEQDLKNMYNQLSDKRKSILNRIQKKLNNFASKEEIFLVHQHQEELKALYEGHSRPSIEGGI